MKLNQTQKDQLWGEEGPYSEAKLVIEHRILDDTVSRIFVVVEVSVNPLTYEIVSKNIKHFEDDEMVKQLVSHSDYRGQDFGYVTMAFMQEYTDEDVLTKAQEAVERSKKTLIKMHKFVIDLLGIHR